MILSSYHPHDCQATCPTCKRLVRCFLHNAILSFVSNRYVELSHEECGTRWKVFLDSHETRVIIARTSGEVISAQ